MVFPERYFVLLKGDRDEKTVEMDVIVILSPWIIFFSDELLVL